MNSLINRGEFTFLLIVLATHNLQGADQPNAEYVRRLIPDHVNATYVNGELIKLSMGGRNAYAVPVFTLSPTFGPGPPFLSSSPHRLLVLVMN